MKNFLLTLFFSSVTSFQIFSQDTPKILIKSDSIACEGDSLLASLELQGIKGTINYVWSSNIGNIEKTGDSIVISRLNQTSTNKLILYVKAYVENEDSTSVLEDSTEIQIYKNPM
ncbi:hypothetical protein [Portibacter marinus]|uniref:hypothetical protein n=1 Tax=Portibacter marinus TaxID=2898660 RepID=UPI001F1AEF96|nr:hypothetical protein [Portibacter marinus]